MLFFLGSTETWTIFRLKLAISTLSDSSAGGFGSNRRTSPIGWSLDFHACRMVSFCYHSNPFESQPIRHRILDNKPASKPGPASSARSLWGQHSAKQTNAKSWGAFILLVPVEAAAFKPGVVRRAVYHCSSRCSDTSKHGSQHCFGNLLSAKKLCTFLDVWQAPGKNYFRDRACLNMMRNTWQDFLI